MAATEGLRQAISAAMGNDLHAGHRARSHPVDHPRRPARRSSLESPLVTGGFLR